MKDYNPEQALLKARREFGEHGGVAPSISRSATFTVLHPGTMPEIFAGLKGPDEGGCFLYSRHFNPTVDVLSRYLAAMEGTEAAICTASGMPAISCAQMLKEMKVDVTYPGLPDHPEHQLAGELGNDSYGFGGILAIDCGTRKKAEELMEALQNDEDFGLIAVSLGYFDTLISCSGSSTSSEILLEDQQKMGLSPGLLRIAMGYTGSLEARMEQMKRAVKKVLFDS